MFARKLVLILGLAVAGTGTAFAQAHTVTFGAKAAGLGQSITLAGVRDEFGTSRKYAQAYLEHLDGEHVTLRRGDERVLRRRRDR